MAKRGRAASGLERDEATAALRATIGGLDVTMAERVARAFAHYFQVVNLAEQHHRVRRGREHERAGEEQPGSLAALAPLLASRVDRARLEGLLGQAGIDLVLTAHPTEAQRRTVLDKHRRIAALLDRHDRESLDAGRGPRRPSRHERGDRPPLADRRDPPRAASRGRRGEERALLPGRHPLSARAGDLRAHRGHSRDGVRPGGSRCRRSCASARGSGPTWMGTRT